MSKVRLYEFSALVRYDVVVAAVSEEDAREAIAAWKQCWPASADLRDVSDVDLTDVRDMPEQTEDAADDLAHEISTKAYEVLDGDDD